MTEELFRNDCYRSEFEAEVVAVNGDLVTLDKTMFYPGGGGQTCDTGRIGGFAVVDVGYEGRDIVHLAPGHGLKTGNKVWCSVDWERRYDLMKGHTAEHLLFSALHRQDPGIDVVKILISPEDKYVVVDRDIPWSEIAAATEFANNVIRENHPVIRSIMSRNDPNVRRVRVKLERIEGNDVSIVEIKDVDVAACCGIHVMETCEIGALFVYKKTHAENNGFKIHFKIGHEAVMSSLDLASSCLSIIDNLRSKPSDIVKTVENMKHDVEDLRRQLKSCVMSSARSIKPKEINGSKVHSGIFPTSDRAALDSAAKMLSRDGGVVALIGRDCDLAIVVMSGNSKVDCGKVVSEAVLEFGGHGGGGVSSARGNIHDTKFADSVMLSLLSRIEKYLN